MKDIDFDELDRAVNSLINPSMTQSSVTVAPSPTTDTTDISPPTTSILPLSVTPLGQRRSSGRFMDVVHPSSDMRSGSVAARSTPTEIVTTLPHSQTVQPEKDLIKPLPVMWPDPIDLQSEPTLSASESISSPEILANDSDKNGPLESPFLTDAKVEKRPLGAFSGDMHESAHATPLISIDTSLKDKELNLTNTDEPRLSDHPIQTDMPLPAELQAGLLSIESNEDPAVSESDSSSSMAESMSTLEPTTSSGPTSILKQYTEQPSTGDKPAGTIFDTAAYKKPQTHSSKKKSGWLIVLWIFLLLAVGGGVGAVVYFFVLPHL